MTTYVHTVPVAARRVLTKACRHGLAPRDWSREARHLQAVGDLAGAPEWVTRELGKADDPRGAAVGRMNAGLWLRGWSERDRDGILAEEHPDRPGTPLWPIPSNPSRRARTDASSQYSGDGSR